MPIEELVFFIVIPICGLLTYEAVGAGAAATGGRPGRRSPADRQTAEARMIESVPEYTVLTVIAVLAVVALELLVLRTGIFRTPQYWVTMLIVFAFQIPVDGWLTKLPDPIVIYNPC